MPYLSWLPLSSPGKPSIVIPVLHGFPRLQTPMALLSSEEGAILGLIVGLHVLNISQIKCTNFLF